MRAVAVIVPPSSRTWRLLDSCSSSHRQHAAECGIVTSNPLWAEACSAAMAGMSEGRAARSVAVPVPTGRAFTFSACGMSMAYS